MLLEEVKIDSYVYQTIRIFKYWTVKAYLQCGSEIKASDQKAKCELFYMKFARLTIVIKDWFS